MGMLLPTYYHDPGSTTCRHPTRKLAAFAASSSKKRRTDYSASSWLSTTLSRWKPNKMKRFCRSRFTEGIAKRQTDRHVPGQQHTWYQKVPMPVTATREFSATAKLSVQHGFTCFRSHGHRIRIGRRHENHARFTPSAILLFCRRAQLPAFNFRTGRDTDQSPADSACSFSIT